MQKWGSLESLDWEICPSGAQDYILWIISIVRSLYNAEDKAVPEYKEEDKGEETLEKIRQPLLHEHTKSANIKFTYTRDTQLSCNITQELLYLLKSKHTLNLLRSICFHPNPLL